MTQTYNLDQGASQVRKGRSQNAVKFGVYSNTLLPHESASDVEALIQSMQENNPSHNPQVQMLIRQYVQILLRGKRLEDAQAEVYENHWARQDSRDEFCRQAGISPIWYGQLPDWYFEQNSGPKKLAIQVGKSVGEAKQLIEHYSNNLLLNARTIFPNLWAEVMGSRAGNSNLTLDRGLEVKFMKKNTIKNLEAYIEDTNKARHFELLWTVHHQRYEALIRSLQAQALLNLSSKPELQKVEGQLHRRRLDIEYALGELKKAHAIEVMSVEAQPALSTASTQQLTADSSVGDRGDTSQSQ